MFEELENCYKKFRNKVALYHQPSGDCFGEWKRETYEKYYNDTLNCARAFVKLGLEPGKGVAVLGWNAPQWFHCDLAATAWWVCFCSQRDLAASTALAQRNATHSRSRTLNLETHTTARPTRPDFTTRRRRTTSRTRPTTLRSRSSSSTRSGSCAR